MKDNRPVVAIIGANGQVGKSILADKEFNDQYNVIALCRSVEAKKAIEHYDVEKRVGLLTEGEGQRLITGCSMVINLAWPSGKTSDTLRISREILQSVVSHKDVTCLIQISSVAVYGEFIMPQSSFESPKPDARYGLLKLRFEDEAIQLSRAHNKRLMLLRLGHVFGHRQWWSRFIVQAILREELLPYDGTRLSNSVHCSEVPHILATMLKDYTTPLIVNGPSIPQRSWREVFDWHSDILELPRVGTIEMPHMQRIEKILKSRREGSYAFLKLQRCKDRVRNLFQLMIPSGRVSRKIMNRALSHSWLVSSGVPGPCVTYNPIGKRDILMAAEEQEALRKWYREAFNVRSEGSL